MQGDTKGTKKKKKTKFGYRLYAIVIFLLTITNITLAALLLTHVQNIQVSGNAFCSASDIRAWVEQDPLTVNSLYTLGKIKTGAYTLPKYLKDVDAKLTAPWEVEIIVEEKQIVGCVIVGQSYVYFDEEGLVLEKVPEYREGIPLIEGLEVKKAEKYKELKTSNKKVFSYIVNATREMDEREIVADRLTWEDDSINLYFGGVCVKLGKLNFDIKMDQLPPVLAELEGKEGVLNMEHYTADNKTFSFEKNEEEN